VSGGGALTLLAAHVWESTLFAALLAALLGIVRPASARLRHALFGVALLKFLVPSGALFTAVVWVGRKLPAWGAPPPEVGAAAARAGAWLSPPWLEGAVAGLPGAAVLVALAAWAAGALAFLGASAVQLRRVRREIAPCAVVTAGRELEALRRAAARLGCRPPALVVAPHTAAPYVHGLRRPRLVFPAALAAELSDDELDAVMLHEVLHVRRRDNLAALAGVVTCAAFWANPLVWLLTRRLVHERELACDAGVLSAQRLPGSYAVALAKAVRFGAGRQPSGLSGIGGAGLRARLDAILRGAPARTAVRDGLALAAAAALLLSWVAAANPCLPP
jgi:Zn-dependent protease with chaperone function